MEKFCDAVFEGGGVRGIGYVGAIKKIEEAGYKFRYVAGSSAGAIIAALIAAGYTAEEMRVELESVNFEKFKQPYFKNTFAGLGALSVIVNATKNFGMYVTNHFEQWIAELLARKNVKTFADLYGRLKVTATNVTEEKTIILPDDLEKYGIDPNTFSVAAAIRMSMSIPGFYAPYELIDEKGVVHYIVDGGMLANYPIWIHDDGRNRLDVPVFGFRFIHYPGQMKSKKTNVFSYAKQIVTTIVEAGGGQIHTIIPGDLQRTIYIDTKVGGEKVGMIDFDLKPSQVHGLYENGQAAAETFLAKYDHKEWNRVHRNK